jgi:hypothetical protein
MAFQHWALQMVLQMIFPGFPLGPFSMLLRHELSANLVGENYLHFSQGWSFTVRKTIQESKTLRAFFLV